MNAWEYLMMVDITKTLLVELFAEFKESGVEMTKEEFIQIAELLKERRKAAIAIVKEQEKLEPITAFRLVRATKNQILQ